MTEQPPSDTTRRDVLRYGLAVAWTVPTIMTFRPTPASAGSEAPRTDSAPAEVAASDTRGGTGAGGEIASTGGGFAWLALAGNAAVATGAAAVLHSRSQQASAEAAEPTPGDPRP